MFLNLLWFIIGHNAEENTVINLYNIEKSIAIKNKKNGCFEPDMECFHFTV
jgi:hypothetical protein